MRYLGDNNVQEIHLNWEQNIDAIAAATSCIAEADISQPLKPYLRYGDLQNRIIAMPAYVGGEINQAGIKWIASFPENIQKGINRAHSVIILNDAKTGEPISVINSGSISAIRTASVSGLLLREYMKLNRQSAVKVGIVGYGPIGQYHLRMCVDVLGDSLEEVLLYDLKSLSKDAIPANIRDRVTLVNSWQEAYTDADVFITCTVSKKPYIDHQPKKGSLHLNVSLRDYKTTVFPWFENAIIVDDWNEVCREKTDIEMMHLENGLTADGVKLIQDVLNGDLHHLDEDQPIMFNPMGMAVFDMAIAGRYLSFAEETNVGVLLES